MSLPRDRILIIGVGNEYRCDDGAGLIVARRLKQQTNDDVTVLEQSGEGAALMEAWKGADTVVLIDAVNSGAEAGTIHRLEAHAQPMPRKFFRYSTHAFSVGEAVELARTLGELPDNLIVFGIEGKTFKAGNGLSGEVKIAVHDVVGHVINELARWSQARQTTS